MDRDLTREIERLNRIHDQDGPILFRHACFLAWMCTRRMTRPSPLFAFCSAGGKERQRRDGKPLGCPFSIRHTELLSIFVPLHAWTDAWTEAIRKDDRIPRSESRIEPDTLIVLAEWQQNFRDYFATERRRQLRSRPRRLRAMLKNGL